MRTKQLKEINIDNSLVQFCYTYKKRKIFIHLYAYVSDQTDGEIWMVLENEGKMVGINS